MLSTVARVGVGARDNTQAITHDRRERATDATDIARGRTSYRDRTANGTAAKERVSAERSVGRESAEGVFVVCGRLRVGRMAVGVVGWWSFVIHSQLNGGGVEGRAMGHGPWALGRRSGCRLCVVFYDWFEADGAFEAPPQHPFFCAAIWSRTRCFCCSRILRTSSIIFFLFI